MASILSGAVAWIGRWGRWRVGIGGRPPADPESTMPFKANADRRHHIPKQKRKVTNWATEHAREGAYDASLRQRGA
jgi:hypothetical protein